MSGIVAGAGYFAGWVSWHWWITTALVVQLKCFNATSWTTSAFVANGLLYAANGGGEHTDKTSKHQVQALDPTTGKVLWAGDIGQHHWSSPILANGTLYMVDGNSGGFGTGTSGDLIAWTPGGR